MANKLVDEAGLTQAMTEVNNAFIKNTDTLFTFGDTPIKKGGSVNLPSLYELVSTLPSDPGANTGKIFLVAAENTGTDNTYAEYIAVDKRALPTAPHNWQWEKLGEYQPTVDLTPYAKQADLTSLTTRVTTAEGTITQHTTKIAENTSAINAINTTVGQHTTKLTQLDYTVLSTAAVTSLCNTIFGS